MILEGGFMTWRMGISRAGVSSAVLASVFAVGCAVEDSPGNGAGAPGGQEAALQQRVDDVLASIPGGHQVSATQIDYDGLRVTFDPDYSPDRLSDKGAFAVSNIACASGWFCIVVRGTRFEFFTCQMWNLSNWTGSAPFNNNQTGHAVARAYNQNLTREVFTNTAPSSGTVDVGPWWHFQPCGGPDLPGP
jgi:hypothetical protein